MLKNSRSIIFVTICMLFASVFGILFPQQAHAQNDENFHVTLKTTYTVNELGTTNVEHSFSIKNLTPAYFISKYGLQLSSKNISDIRIVDGDSEIPAEIVQTDNMTSIGITFPEKILGENKIRTFKLSYTNPDIAHLNGSILEVTIPQLADSQKYNEYSVALNTPEKFGKPTRVTPDKYSYTQENGYTILTFDRPSGRGISAIYGDTQVFNLNLQYHLDNPNNQPVITQISFPPDTPYQKMNYTGIEPLPQKIEVDDDGNWIATYLLPSNTTTSVTAQAQAILTLEPDYSVPSAYPNTKHTNEQEYWTINDPTILNKINSNQSPQDIYSFVTDTLSYTKEDITQNLDRLGSVQALENPTIATCQEFTDVFIAMARANSVPSRRITGYALTNDSSLRPLSLVDDILHAWPEYYDDQTKAWVPIDPTWGSTTGGVDYFNQFDLNHIVFAINGESSTLPHPAGAYKLEGNSGKNIEVSVATDMLPIKPDISTELEQKMIGPTAIPGAYDLIITNNTGTAWYGLEIDVNTAQDTIIKMHTKDTTIPALLPHQSLTIPISFYTSDTFTPSSDAVYVTITQNQETLQSLENNVSTAPQALKNLNQPIIAFGVVIGCTLLALITGSVFIFRRK